MNITVTDGTSDVLVNIIELASWNRERSSDELRNFVESHHAALPVDIELV